MCMVYSNVTAHVLEIKIKKERGGVRGAVYVGADRVMSTHLFRNPGTPHASWAHHHGRPRCAHRKCAMSTRGGLPGRARTRSTRSAVPRAAMAASGFDAAGAGVSTAP